MTLRTGNNGFTLLEVMIATAVLSLGAALIYQSFFFSLDTFNYSSNVLNTIPWMDEKIWRAQERLEHAGPDAQIETQGELEAGSKKINWNLAYNPVGSKEGLYRIDLDLSWKEGKRDVSLLRSAYAIYEKEE